MYLNTSEYIIWSHLQSSKKLVEEVDDDAIR